jgi:hypothetical protein
MFKGFNHLALHHLPSLHRLRYHPLRIGGEDGPTPTCLTNMGPCSLSPSKGKGLLRRLLLHLHRLHLLLRMWQVHLTTWKKSKHLHLPSKDKIGALASPPRSLATIHTTMEGALTRETDLRDSDRQLLLLQGLLGCLMTKGGEDSGLKTQICVVWAAVCVAPV